MYYKYTLFLGLCFIPISLFSMDSAIMVPVEREEEFKETEIVAGEQISYGIDTLLPLDFSTHKQTNYLGKYSLASHNEYTARKTLDKAEINSSWPIKRLDSKDVKAPYYTTANCLYINEKEYENLSEEDKNYIIGCAAYHIQHRTTHINHAKDYIVIAGATYGLSRLLRYSMAQYNPQVKEDSRILATERHLLAQIKTRIKSCKNNVGHALFIGLGTVYLANRIGFTHKMKKWYNRYTYPSAAQNKKAHEYSLALNGKEPVLTKYKTDKVK